MKAFKDAERNIAVVLDVERLTRLHEMLSRYSEKLAWRLVCNEGTRLYASSLEEVLKFPNTRIERLQGLVVGNGDDEKAEPRFNVQFNQEGVGYIISGEREIVKEASRDIEEFFGSTKQWYSWFLFQPSIVNWFVAGGAAGSMLTLLLFWPQFPKPLPLWVLIYPAAVAVCAFVLVRFRMRYFPTVIFAIGEGKERYQDLREARKRWRTGALATIVLGVVGSVAATALWQLFLKR